MKIAELSRFKKLIGSLSFNIFFSNENKILNKKQNIKKQSHLFLSFVPEGKQTQTVSFLRSLTGWSVRFATTFVKEKSYPKIVISNFELTETSSLIIENANKAGIIFEIK